MAELAIDYWLATHVPLGAGSKMKDRMRAYSTAALKVAKLCQGRVAPFPWKAGMTWQGGGLHSWWRWWRPPPF